MITVTKEIQKILAPYNSIQRNEILEAAWQACCDGNFLASLGLDFDPWSEGNEIMITEIEMEAVTEVIKNR